MAAIAKTGRKVDEEAARWSRRYELLRRNRHVSKININQRFTFALWDGFLLFFFQFLKRACFGTFIVALLSFKVSDSIFL